MTDSDPQLIRHATIDDLDALAAMESECFPAAEAADRSSLRARIETYPECFWLLMMARSSWRSSTVSRPIGVT